MREVVKDEVVKWLDTGADERLFTLTSNQPPWFTQFVKYLDMGQNPSH